MSKANQTVSLLSVGAMALVLLGAGCMPQAQEVEDAAMMNDEAAMEDAADTMMAGDAMNDDTNMVGGDAMMEEGGDAMMEKDGDAMMEQASSGSFTEYSDAAVASADGSVVLAFFADWCSTCKAAKKDINAQLDEIPGGLTILDVDFDNSNELRQKYKVTTQHTFVQVDADGNMIKSWRGGNTLESIVENVS